MLFFFFFFYIPTAFIILNILSYNRNFATS